jgi:dihydrofolate reductase
MINIIVAMTKDNGIGYKGTLPWHISDDLKRFKKLTSGSTVVMGRKTWDSLPIKPLPNRKNIILTRNNLPNEKLLNENILFIDDIKTINDIKSDVWIIGGSEIYNLAFKYLHIDKIYVTEINNNYECDTFFPKIDSNFIISYEEYKNLDISFKIYKNLDI